MAKALKTITIVKREGKGYGYDEEAWFVKEQYSQGGVSYSLTLKDRWEDGHFTYPSRYFKKFKTADEGNKLYKQYLAEGFKFADQYSFEPMQMDMR